MALNIGSSTDISDIASRLMDRVDANRDGQLSKDEFNGFLSSLLQGVASTSIGAKGTSATATQAALASRSLTALSLGAGNYQPIPGFDNGKLNDLAHTTPKYMFARAVQDIGLIGTPTTANLQAVVDQYNLATGGSAKVKGDDTIDFGGEVGVVDVIFSVGDPQARWQWIPAA
ncbi:MAG: hypothetical protein U0Q55_01715 [Vicinamibacterales bacterium]